MLSFPLQGMAFLFSLYSLSPYARTFVRSFVCYSRVFSSNSSVQSPSMNNLFLETFTFTIPNIPKYSLRMTKFEWTVQLEFHALTSLMGFAFSMIHYKYTRIVHLLLIVSWCVLSQELYIYICKRFIIPDELLVYKMICEVYVVLTVKA